MMEKEVHGVETNLGVQDGTGIWTHCTCMLSHFSHVQLFVTPMDWSPPHSSIHGVFQARILEWVVISFFRGSSLPSDQTHVSCLAGGFFTAEPPGKPYNPGKRVQSKQKVTLTPYRIGKNSLLSRNATTILNLTSCCEFQSQ